MFMIVGTERMPGSSRELWFGKRENIFLRKICRDLAKLKIRAILQSVKNLHWRISSTQKRCGDQQRPNFDELAERTLTMQLILQTSGIPQKPMKSKRSRSIVKSFVRSKVGRNLPLEDFRYTSESYAAFFRRRRSSLENLRAGSQICVRREPFFSVSIGPDTKGTDCISAGHPAPLHQLIHHTVIASQSAWRTRKVHERFNAAQWTVKNFFAAKMLPRSSRLF